MKPRLECISCDAMFSVQHDMDNHYYRVAYCPFCGSEVEQEEELEFDDIDDEQ